MLSTETGGAGTGRRCAVLGSPIAHSLSPVLHRAAYAELGLDWTYEAIEIGSAAELNAFVAGLGPQWRGLSLTMPLKEVAVNRASFDDLVMQAGCANTLVVHHPDGRPPACEMTNTDVLGLEDVLRPWSGSLAQGATPVEAHAVILGGGATARAAFVALGRLGVRRVTVVARTPDRVRPWQPVAKKLGVELEVVPWGTPPRSDLLVSAVTAGVADDLADELVASSGAVFDIIYDPWPTPLARAAEHAGLPTFSGLDLLVAQAAHQVRLMTGQAVEPGVLMSAGQEELRRRGAL
ncbi:shikimate dehydrogenase [Mariniluteicoccus flavus]